MVVKANGATESVTMIEDTVQDELAADYEVVHENEFYYVRTYRGDRSTGDFMLKSGENYYHDYYEIVNKSNEMVEGRTIIYPEALFVSTAYARTLTNEEWRGDREKIAPPENVTKIKPRLN